MTAIETQGIAMEAVRIATDLMMSKPDGEAAFIEARDQCREAQAKGDGGCAKLYSTVGSTLVELGAITGDRALELIDPKIEMIDTETVLDEIDLVQIPTKINAACDRHAGRWGLDTVKVKAEGENRVAVATNGKILAAVDCHTSRDMDLNAHRTTMPTKKTDRNVVIQYDDSDRPSASQNHKSARPITPVVFPTIEVFPKRDDLGQTMTFSVGQLRALLDALCPVNNPEALVTIGLNTSVNKPSAIATEHGIGAIMPYGKGQDEDQNQTRMGDWDAEVKRVTGLCDQG